MELRVQSLRHVTLATTDCPEEVVIWVTRASLSMRSTATGYSISNVDCFRKQDDPRCLNQQKFLEWQLFFQAGCVCHVLTLLYYCCHHTLFNNVITQKIASNLIRPYAVTQNQRE